MLKERLRPTVESSEQQSSFFDVEVNLKVPCVVVSPSLDEIQEAVNTCAKKVMLVPTACACACSEQALSYFLKASAHTNSSITADSVACFGVALTFRLSHVT